MQSTELMTAPQLEFNSNASSKWESERASFLNMFPTLLKTFRDQWVAIHNGEVVDSGEDKIPLALRVYSKIGYTPIYIGRVSSEPLDQIRIPSPRTTRVAQKS
jgi:hypothetical protein